MITNNTIVLDLDGTILNKDLTIEKEIVIKLKELSINNDIVIATGNNYNITLDIINKNNIEKIINANVICSNGEVIYNLLDNRIIYKNFINFNTLVKIINFLKQNNIYWYLISNNNLYCEEIKYNSTKYIKNNRYNTIIINNYNDIKNIEIDKIIINCDDFNNMNNCINELQDTYKVNCFAETRYKEYNNLKYFQNNILPNNVNKYTSLKRIISLYNLSKDIISIGDGINDYELIKNSKFGICYQYSCNSLKNNACFIIPNDKNILYALDNINDWYNK